MHIGRKLAATAALIGAAVLGGVAAAAPAGAAPQDAGIHLVTGHDVGVYGYYKNISDATKVAPNLLYNANPAITDGIDADCYSYKGQSVGSSTDTNWYHTKYEYYNHSGQKLQVYAWTYAPYVDGDAAIHQGLLPFCNY